MSDKLRIAIVGTGSRGTSCFGELLKERKDVEIAALCDPNPVRAKAAAEVLEIDPPIYTSMEDMAAKEKLDGVVITSPDCYHHDCAMTALKHGWRSDGCSPKGDARQKLV